MSTIYFPLRSNSAWFIKEEMKNALEARIKTCLVLYDELVFQDAVYHCTIWDSGCFDMIMPGDKVGEDRSKITYFNPNSNSALFLGPTGGEAKHQLIGGIPKASYHADFYPILNEANLIGQDHIKLSQVEVSQEFKNKAKKSAKNSIGTHDLNMLLGDNPFFQEKVFESLIIDSALSSHLKCPFVIDENVGPLVQLKNTENIKLHEGMLKDVFYNSWINFGLPDFSQASWEEINNLRLSNAGVELRKMIENIVAEISKEYSCLSDIRDVTIIVERHFTKELINELIANLPTKKNVVVNFGLNLVPFGSVAGSLKDVIDLALSKSSWVSLLH